MFEVKNLIPDIGYFTLFGYQYLQANVSVSENQVTFQYTFTDYFGAGVGDAGNALLGLASMYFDQHNYGTSQQYIPFVWSISVTTVVPR